MIPLIKKQSSTDSQSSRKKMLLSDYKVLKSIGEGAFGEVYLVKQISNDKTFALKSIDKKFLAKQKKEHYVFQEKLILQSINFPFVVKLFATFQDESKLYFLMENIPNGELSKYLRSKSRTKKKNYL
jgi:serine/threonine protein kinase